MNSETSRKLCVIPGDGIGAEVTEAAIRVLQAATEQVQIVHAEAGWRAFCDKGDSVPESTLDRIRDCGAALFGAVSSPSKKVQGYRSAILKIRQQLDLYGNLRPIESRWAAGAHGTGHRDVSLIVVRENSEGLYSGIEHFSDDRAVAEKIVTRKASERIGGMAARIATANNHEKVTIVHKANVLPVSEGLFRDSVKQAIQESSPELQINEGLVDIVAYRLAGEPEQFQTLVTTNMFGDILSDLAAVWCGGMGRAPSVNLGDECAVAEPVHGSAPDIAGQGIADPTATILSLAMLARYYWNDQALSSRLQSAAAAAITQQGTEPIKTDAFTDLVISGL